MEVGQSIGREEGGPLLSYSKVRASRLSHREPYIMFCISGGDLCLNPSKGRETSPLESCFMIHAQLASLGSNGE